MSNDQELEQRVQEIITEVCRLMFAHGYQQVSVGAIMRLVGVPNDRADDFDDQYVVNDSDFWAELGEPEPRDASATLH